MTVQIRAGEGWARKSAGGMSQVSGYEGARRRRSGLLPVATSSLLVSGHLARGVEAAQPLRQLLAGLRPSGMDGAGTKRETSHTRTREGAGFRVPNSSDGLVRWLVSQPVKHTFHAGGQTTCV